MTDGMFALKQLVEKRLEMQGRMAVGFVELEKAYDTVTREMVTATVRWMGVPAAIIADHDAPQLDSGLEGGGHHTVTVLLASVEHLGIENHLIYQIYQT